MLPPLTPMPPCNRPCPSTSSFQRPVAELGSPQGRQQLITLPRVKHTADAQQPLDVGANAQKQMAPDLRCTKMQKQCASSGIHTLNFDLVPGLATLPSDAPL